MKRYEIWLISSQNRRILLGLSISESVDKALRFNWFDYIFDLFIDWLVTLGQMFAVNKTSVNAATDPHEPPPNFAFLEILAEFSAKLMKQDKKTVSKQKWVVRWDACMI